MSWKNLDTFDFDNSFYIKEGEPTLDKGIVSNFSNSDYISLPLIKNVDSLKIDGNFTLQNTNNQSIFRLSGFELRVEDNELALYNNHARFDGYITVGNPTIANNIASNFSATDYIRIPNPFNPSNSSWQIKLKIRTSNDILNKNNNIIIGNYDGSFYNSPEISIVDSKFCVVMPHKIASDYPMFTIYSDAIVSENTDYWLRLGFTGDSYYFDYSLDGINYSSTEVETNETIYQATESFNIGYSAFDTIGKFSGSIYLNEFQITIDQITSSIKNFEFPAKLGNYKYSITLNNQNLTFTCKNNNLEKSIIFENFMLSDSFFSMILGKDTLSYFQGELDLATHKFSVTLNTGNTIILDGNEYYIRNSIPNITSENTNIVKEIAPFKITREYIQSLIPDNIRNTWTFERVADLIYCTINLETDLSIPEAKTIKTYYDDILYFCLNNAKLSKEQLLVKLKDNGFSYLLDLLDESNLNNLGVFLALINMLKGTFIGFQLMLDLLNLHCEIRNWIDYPKELDIFTMELLFKTVSETISITKTDETEISGGKTYYKWIYENKAYYTDNINPTIGSVIYEKKDGEIVVRGSSLTPLHNDMITVSLLDDNVTISDSMKEKLQTLARGYLAPLVILRLVQAQEIGLLNARVCSVRINKTKYSLTNITKDYRG